MKFILAITLILVATGIIMIYSATAIYAGDKAKFDNDQYYFLKRQLIWSFLGIVVMIISSVVPLDFLRKMAVPLMIVVWLGLVLVFLPGLGKEVGGAHRWFVLGKLTFQPAEAAKLAVILYIADFLTRKSNELEYFKKAVLPLAIVTGITMTLIVMQPDFGTCVLIGMVSMTVMLIGGVKIKHLSGLAFFVLPVLALLVIKAQYRLERVLVFIDPWKDPGDAGYQITQSFIGFGSGGLLGRGWGNSIQKLYYLPESHTDFIFSVIGEEKGFLGAFAILALFAGFVYMAIKISIGAQNRFGYLVGIGIAVLIGLQSVMHMGVVTGCLPTKGLPLPFVSFGGSSLIVNLAGVGILMNIARGVKPRKGRF